MYVRRIDIGSVSGIDEAIEFLQDNLTKEAMQKKVDKAASELIEEALEVAKGEYPDVVKLETDHGEGKHTLTATHEAIAFIEFGAGWGVNSAGIVATETELQTGIDISVGSYSRENEGEFWNTDRGYWHFGRQKYTEIEARPGMELARQHIADNGREKLREVFDLD